MNVLCRIFGHIVIEPRTGRRVNRYIPSAEASSRPSFACRRCGRRFGGNRG